MLCASLVIFNCYTTWQACQALESLVLSKLGAPDLEEEGLVNDPHDEQRANEVAEEAEEPARHDDP